MAERSRSPCRRVLLVHRSGVPRRRRGEIGRERLHRRRRPPIRPTSRSAAATPAMPRRSASPSTLSSSATTTCSTSSSRPTTRPSSTARATTSARSIARRSFPQDDEQERRRAPRSSAPTPSMTAAWSRPSSRRPNGIRPRTITRIIGPARASGTPIAWRSSRPSCRSCARASRRALKSAAGDRLARRRPAQPVVDRRAEAVVGHRRDGDPRLCRRVGLVEQVEQARGGLDQVAGRAEADVARRSARSRSEYSSSSAARRRRAAAVSTARNGWRAGPGASIAPSGEAGGVDRDRPGPQQAQRAAGRRDDGRFEAALGRAGVDDQRDPAAEAVQHMLGAGRADRSAGVGRRGGERPAGRRAAAPASRGGRARGAPIVGRPAVTIEAMPASCAQRHDQGQRPRPMLLGQRERVGAELADRCGRGEVGDMDDQRIEARPALGLVDSGDRCGVGGVGGEAVDGLGRRPRPARRRGSAAPPRRLPSSLKGSDPRRHRDAATGFRRSPE